MNKSYVSIWSEALGSWVAASEHTARRGKRSKSRCVMGSIGVALGVIAGYSGNAAAKVANPIGAYGNIAIDNSTSTAVAASASTPGSIAIGAGANAKGDVNYDGSSAIAIGDSAEANGGGTIALGEMAVVNGDRSAAFGPASTVSASDSVALGFGSTVTATNSVALGVNSVADRANTVSVGTSTGQRQIVNLAAGTQSTDAVNLSQLGGVVNALGGGAAIESDGTISAPSYSVGGTTVNNVGDAFANIDESVRRNATLMDNLNDGLVMIHNIALDNSKDIAINKADITKMSGDITNVTNSLNDGTIGLVQHDAATRNITVARDLDGTTVDFGGTEGARTLSGVKAGALSDTSTEAVNGSQLYATNQQVNQNTNLITSLDDQVTNIGGQVTDVYEKGTKYFHANSTGEDSSAVGQDSVAIGMGAVSNNTNDVALGASATASGGNSTAIGNHAQAAAAYATALGQAAAASGFVATAIGSSAEAAGDHATAVGAMADAAGASATAIGTSAQAAGGWAIAIGSHAQAAGIDAIALGAYAATTVDRATALGADASATEKGSVALGAGSTTSAAVGTSGATIGGTDYAFAGANPASTVSVGSAGNERTITNVAAGRLSATSTDAVNGSQLHATNLSVTANATNIAANTAAITSIDGRVTNVEGSVTNLTQQLDGGSVGLVQQDATSKAITVARDLDGTTVDFGGTEGARTLSGVKAGALSDTSTEAVNGSQLHATNQNVTANTTAITTIDGRVTNVEGSVTNLTQQLDGGSVGLVQQDATSKAITVARDLDGTTVDFGGTDGARSLSGVKAGALSDTSTEAVNGSQLHATNQNVTANTTAITTIDGRVTNVEGSVTNLTQQLDGGSVGLVQQDATSKTITVARDLDGTTVDFGGTEGARTLSGVKAGALSDTSTETVNGSQLHATNQNVTANTTAITTIDGRVTNVEGSVTNLTQQLDGGSVGLVQQDATSKTITVARDLDGTTVDFGGTEGARTLSGVKAGALSDTSTEAVNGSQLHATNQNVTANTASIAANTTAITTIDGRVTNVEGSVTNLTQQLDGGSVGLVQQDATSKAITVARDLDGTTVDFGGTEGARTLSGVKAGALSDTSTEAVNGSQLHATNQNVTANTASIAANTTAITTIDGRVTNVEGSVTNLTQQLDGGSVGLVQQDATSKAITVARDLDGTTVDFGGTDGARSLSGVADGAIAAGSKEAVNGSQLYANSASVAAGLGGGSTVNADGTISAPSYSVGGTTVHSVGDAVTNLDDRVTQNTTDITKLQTQVGDVGTQLSGAVQYDRNVDGSVNFGSVTLGGGQSAGPVTLTNVANGTSQYDAVNYGQLSALQDQVTDLNGQVKDLGSQVSNIQPVTPDVSSSDRNNDAVANAAMPGTGAGSTVVGANASAAAENAVAVGTNAAATGVNSTAIGTGSQAGDANSVALGQGSVTDRDNSVSVGSAGHERQITNVAAGTADTDAVNFGQMNSSVAQGVQQANNYTDQRINATNQAVNNLARNAYSGIAAATALTMIPEVDQGKKLSFGIAAATYNGYQAIALGGTARIKDNIKVKAGVGMSAGGTTAGIGASYQW
ncbi:YadA-like family protein [Paraburkholderia sp. 35.1]|uniref:YadA-like family protein n=1 Tax=Paraburkholderia sp. 35.1 TaxID=2991058 RepID=UPI003D24233B